MSSEDRFLTKVAKGDGCWEWTGCRTRKGYGQFHSHMEQGHRVQIGAHRWAYEHWVDPIPEGLQIDHLCRNRSCVRPDHLEAVTCRENLSRGNGLAAFNTLKTHCLAGHPYDEANTYVRPDGSRECRACKYSTLSAWRARREKVTE